MAKLSPVFNDQTFDASGNPAVGYKLFTYVAGSSTKQTSYTDSAGTVPHPNPIILNASGYPTTGPIWLTEGTTYKMVLAPSTDSDPPTSPIKTVDNITGVNDSSSTNTQWVSAGVTPTYVSASSFTLPGDQTSEFHAGRRLKFTVTVGTVYGTIASSAFGALTTVTVTMDSGMALDAGLSAVNVSILRADRSALPTAPTPAQFDNSTKLATMAALQGAGLHFQKLQGINISASTALSLAQAGHWAEVSGAGVIVTLPAIAGAPEGLTSYTFRALTNFTLKGNGAESIIPEGGGPFNTYSVLKGQTLTVVSNGTGQSWYVLMSGFGAGSFAGSLSAPNSYQPLPGGLIMQVGSVVQAVTSGVAATSPLGIAYPNAQIRTLVTPGDTGTGTVSSLEAGSGSLTSFQWLPTVTGTVRINYISWGK